MHDHRIPIRHAGDRASHLLHPAGVLVPERVGQLNAALLLPLTLDDVQIRAAEAGAPIRTITSSGSVISGSDTSSMSGRSPYSWSRTAFIAAQAFEIRV
jgi:hypothetical protein